MDTPLQERSPDESVPTPPWLIANHRLMVKSNAGIVTWPRDFDATCSYGFYCVNRAPPWLINRSGDFRQRRRIIAKLAKDVSARIATAASAA